jgi:hypothetical protein
MIVVNHSFCQRAQQGAGGSTVFERWSSYVPPPLEKSDTTFSNNHLQVSRRVIHSKQNIGEDEKAMDASQFKSHDNWLDGVQRLFQVQDLF